MILAVDDLDGQEHDGDDDEQEDDWAVTRPVGIDRRQQQPALAVPAYRRAYQRCVYRIDDGDHVDWKQPQHDAAEREPRERDSLEATGVVGVGKVRLAWPAEEDDAVELDHDVRRQRHREHQCRRGKRYQHVDERLRQARREQECLQQQPLGHEAVQRRQTGNRQRADERQPGNPGHPMYQAAELAQTALLRRVQHRTGSEEQQTLEERVI